MSELAKIEPTDIEDQAAYMVTPMAMIDRALSSGSDIGIIKALIELREADADREMKSEFYAAKAEVMAEMPKIPRTGHNKHTNKKYSTRDDILATVRPVLAKHGMTLSHRTSIEGGDVVVTAVLAHKNGVEEQDSMPLPFDAGQQRNAVQARGSSLTYGQRYTAMSILGLDTGEADDDGVLSGAESTITAEQYQALKVKADQISEDDLTRLLAYLKVDHLEELPLDKLGTADAALDRKLGEVANG